LVDAPSSVTAKVADGHVVTLSQSGGYPFRPVVTMDVRTDSDVEFPLHLRIPGWWRDASLEINGQRLDAKLTSGSIHVVNRQWRDGNRVKLHFPMPLESSR
jgi:DUF1680 family protein